VVELPWAADSCPCEVEAANRATIGIGDSAVQLATKRVRQTGGDSPQIGARSVLKGVGGSVDITRARTLHTKLSVNAGPSCACAACPNDIPLSAGLGFEA
jgi:hypothetical protein